MNTLILFVNGLPASFSLKQEEDSFLLYPDSNPYKAALPSLIEIKKEDSCWVITGTEDENLVDQIIEDLSFLALEART